MYVAKRIHNTVPYLKSQSVASPLTRSILRNLISELIGMPLTETTGFNEIEHLFIDR